MPYLRLYSREMSLGEKRVLGQKLISITLRALQLRPEQRDQITIQFLPRETTPPIPQGGLPSPGAEAVLEVRDRNLTAQKISAFVEAAAPMLGDSAVVKRPSRIARMLGLGAADPTRQIAFQFNATKSLATSGRQSLAPTPMRKAA